MNLYSDKTIQMLNEMEEDVYLVGGAVRDFLLEKETVDKDIIVNNARQFAEKFANKYNRNVISLDEENKIYRIVLEDKINYIDITEPINGSLHDDLKRRDFTINSIAINIKSNEVIDINNGCEDLKRGIIKAISEKNILDDPLRILRAYRFVANLGFKIDNITLAIIEKHMDKIQYPAIERINYELFKLFEGKYCAEVLNDSHKLIEKLYPIFIDVRKVPPNSHHHLGLYEHSVETVNQIQRLYELSNIDIKKHLDGVDFGGFSRLTHLKFVGFLHDIGKYSTWTIEGDRHRFIKHDDVGSKIAKEILKKNKFSKKQIIYISEMIKNHIYPSQVVSAENVNEKNYMRYIRKMEDNVIDNIILAQADRLSANGPAITQEIINTNINNLNKLLEFYLEIKDTLTPIEKLLDGKDIMQIKSIKPSPALGEIINALHKEQLDGNILTKEDAIRFVVEYQLS